jgi:2-oxoglutarate dehydrogenase complex dehydrogenase (E1) component-like enzyme
VAINLPEIVERPVRGVSRRASSSPAVGTHQRHEQEQRLLVEQAFA